MKYGIYKSGISNCVVHAYKVKMRTHAYAKNRIIETLRLTIYKKFHMEMYHDIMNKDGL